MKIKSWSIIVLVILLSLAILYTGFHYYLKQFGNERSPDSSRWGDFGEFQGYFVNLVNMIVIGIIGFITYKTTHNYNSIQLRPFILLMNSQPPSNLKNDISSIWTIVNGANSPASNILVRFYNSGRCSKWVSCYSVGSNSEQALIWLHWASKIEVSYSDITGKKFYNYIYQDLFGETVTIEEKEYLKFLNEAKLNRDNNTIHLAAKFETYLRVGNASGKNSNTLMKPSEYMANFVEPLIF